MSTGCGPCAERDSRRFSQSLTLEFSGYRSYWNYADRKGYSGVCVYTRMEPLAVHYGIGRDEHDHEGRVITLEMPDFYLVCCYTPNSQNPDTPGELPKRLDYRMEWEDAFRKYVNALHDKGLATVAESYEAAANAASGAEEGLFAQTKELTSRTPRPTPSRPDSPHRNAKR